MGIVCMVIKIPKVMGEEEVFHPPLHPDVFTQFFNLNQYFCQYPKGQWSED